MSSIALQLPNNYVEFEREEMEYVDGGYYISHSDLYGMIGTVATTGGVTAIAASMGTIQVAMAASIPGLGTAIAAAGGWILQDVPGAIYDAVLQGKGIDLGIAYTRYGTPYKVSCTVR